MSKDKSAEQDSEDETQAEEQVDFRDNVPNWVEGDTTHGGRGRNIVGKVGCIREKGCRELGGVKVAIFETAVAFPKRLSDNEKWTVVITGLGENGPRTGTKTRAEAMKAARYPSTWSKKCATIAKKVADAKATKEADAEAETASDTASEQAVAE